MPANTDSGYEHFKMIRENSAYRNFLRLEELEAEMQPSLAQNVPEERTITIQEPWTKSQWQVVNQLRAQVLYLQKKVLEKAEYKKKVDKHYKY